MSNAVEKLIYRNLNIAIENPIDSIRSGVSKDGTEWKVKFYYPYGYIEGTKGNDGEEIDCFIGDNPETDSVYIVHQRREDGLYDEDKVLLGFDSLNSARDAYLSHFSTQDFIGKITEMPFFEFKYKLEVEGRKGIKIK